MARKTTKANIQEPQPGEKVEWHLQDGRSVGKVVKKATSPMQIKGHRVAASQNQPEFIVKSDKTGAIAAHKADALTSAK